VYEGHVQAVFKQEIDMQNLISGILRKIQDLQRSLPIVNIGLRNGWLWRMTNPAMLV
jgi:hypothetical protein